MGLKWGRFRRAFVAVSLLASASFGAPENGSVTLEQATKEAKENSNELREAREKVDQFRFEKYGLRSTLFPKLDLTASQTNQKDSVANKSVGAVPFGGESYNLYNVGLRGEQTLLAYGIFSGISRADYQQQIHQLDFEIAERTVTREMIDAFYGTVMNENLVNLLQEQEQTVGEILKIAQQRSSLGGMRRTDVLQVRTRLALLKPKIERAKNDLAGSVAQLASLMGRTENPELRLRARMPSVSIQRMQAHLNLKEFALPELKKLRLRREQIEDEKDVALGKNLPNLKLIGDYRFINYTKTDLMESESNSWSVQVLLTVPLFSGLSSFFERRALNSQVSQVELQSREVSKELALKQIKSRKSLESVEASLASAEEAVKLARQSLTEARREYRYGQIDFLQFMEVEAADFEAATSLLQLRYEAIKAYADYFVASGQSLDVLVDLLTKEEKQ